MAASDPPPSTTPRRVRICRIAGRHLIFDVADVDYLRRNHNISSVFVGTMPQNPTQSIFMGLPIELYAEEAKLLVDRGVGYVVDDTAAHLSRLSNRDGSARTTYVQALRKQRLEVRSLIAEETARKAAESEVLERQARGRRGRRSSREQSGDAAEPVPVSSSLIEPPDNDILPSVPLEPAAGAPVRPTEDPNGPPAVTVMLTPTTSADLVDGGADVVPVREIEVPRSYPLYAHLNSLGYYMTPGLRFGGDYSVYPGDPFRFHAHFLATSLAWEEEISVLDLIAGGRLGTGVKKSFLIGGQIEGEMNGLGREVDGVGPSGSGRRDVRTFCIEWAGM